MTHLYHNAKIKAGDIMVNYVERVLIKSQAKNQVSGKRVKLALMMLIIFAIEYALGILTSKLHEAVEYVIDGFISSIFALSTTHIYLKVTDSLDVEIQDIFLGFYDFLRAITITVFVSVKTILWSLLLIIPGVIKSLAYSMTTYIVAENRDMSVSEAMRKSEEMMQGHKMDLFYLNLSFTGWILLTVVTCGIAALWTAPYINATHANFYRSIKNMQANDKDEEYYD